MLREYIDKDQELAYTIWDEFVEEIKHKNRYFLSSKIAEEIDKLIKYSGVISLLFDSAEDRMKVYRARVGDFSYADDNEMRPPPKEKTRDGRCNPIGISYFYVAGDPKTAISEIRSSIGTEVTVATFELKEPLHLINFRVSKIWEKHMNTKLSFERYQRYFLDIVLEYLSKPILNDLDYLPIQYITEYIKNHKDKYDGLQYESAIRSKGYNILLFNDNKFNLIGKKLYRVTGHEISYIEQ